KGRVLIKFIWQVPFLRNSIDIREDWPYGLKDESMREVIGRFYKNAKANEFSKKTLLFGSPFFPLACLYQHSLFAEAMKKEIPFVNNPILILHSEEDDMVSIRNARYLLNHIGSREKSLVALDDSYHMITIDKQKDKVIQETINFLDKL
ncbi:MAG: alpha/beta hydrolase, partial [Candidatus Omnitrophica bacterium]|nr:alpha/beta hydrolase [Candidatus Omnitrophota bacterium]